MTVNIGIFQKQEDVVEAIRLLREAGLDHDDIRVIVKNAENAP
jgi:3-hydroxyisobutyrate dehydrogenase-like beta-hydroxyacid dehydrogenase